MQFKPALLARVESIMADSRRSVQREEGFMSRKIIIEPKTLSYGMMDQKSIMPGYWRVEEVPGANFYAYTNTQAKAALIMSGPDLLAALQNLLNNANCSNGAACKEEAITEARRALSNARVEAE